MKSCVLIESSSGLNELLHEHADHGLAHHHLHIQLLQQVLRELLVLSARLQDLTAGDVQVDVSGVASTLLQQLLLLFLQCEKILA